MAVTTQTPNELMIVFSNTISSGFAALQGPVNGVFGTMIALVVALTGIQWALSPNREVLTGGFGKVLLIGFFAYVINDWQALSQTIWAGFIDIGLRAGGGGLGRADFLNPGLILEQGWRIVKALGDTPASTNPADIFKNLTDALLMGLAMIGIMLAFAVLALQIIVALLEFKIVTLGGFVLLPFGIWSKSAFLAERPLGFVVASGLKVLALAIVVAGARSIFDQLQPSTTPDVYEALAILAASLLLAMVAIFIPSLAAALVTGGPALGAGAAVTGGLAVAGVGALATAGVVGLGAGAARLAGSSRAAAGAVSGRPPGSSGGASPTPGPASPRPPNDNPPRGGSGAPGGVGEAGRPWSGPASTSPPSETAPLNAPVAEAPAGDSSQPETGPRQAPAQDGGTEQARRAFHRAVRKGEEPAETAREKRSAVVRAFFVANAGRSLLPAGETSGTVSPQLKSEEP